MVDKNSEKVTAGATENIEATETNIETTKEVVEEVKPEEPVKEETQADVTTSSTEEENPVEKEDVKVEEGSNFVGKFDYKKFTEEKADTSSGNKQLFDEMYIELEKAVMELKEANEKIEGLKTEVTKTEEEKSQVSDDVRTKEEIIKIKEQQLAEIEKRVFQIEEEKRIQKEAEKTDKVNRVVDKYVKSGIINDEDRDKKVEELKQLSEDAIVELEGVIVRKLETVGEKVTTSSEELKVEQPINPEDNLKRESKPQTKEEQIDDLFAKIQVV